MKKMTLGLRSQIIRVTL